MDCWGIKMINPAVLGTFMRKKGVEVMSVDMGASWPGVEGQLDLVLNDYFFIVFDRAVDESTVAANVELLDGTTPVECDIVYYPDWFEIDITPTSDLDASTEYTIHIGTGLKGAAGESLDKEYNIHFTTCPPYLTLSSSDPADEDIDVPSNKTVTVTFSKNIDEASVTEHDGIGLFRGSTGQTVACTTTVVDNVVTFSGASFLAGEVYEVDIRGYTYTNYEDSWLLKSTDGAFFIDEMTVISFTIAP